MNSLEKSLQFGLVSSLIFLMFVFWWTSTLGGRLLTESYIFERLETDANAVVSILEFPAIKGGTVTLGPYKLNPAYQRPASGQYFMVKLGDDLLQSRSAWDQFIEIPNIAPGSQLRRRAIGVADEPLLIWFGGFASAGREFTVAVAENITPIETRLKVFQWFSAIVALLLLAASVGVQRWVVRGSVEKLDAIRLDMLKLEHGKTVALSEDVPSEILPLVLEFNRLLRRFDQRLKQSRNAVGNLAHSLKGPLSLLLRTANDTSSDSSNWTQVQQNAEHIRRLIDSELKRARLAGRSTVGKLFTIEKEIPALIGLLKQVYFQKQIDVQYYVGPEVEIVHDRQDMLELIGNLLDNAVKWSQSTVMLSIRSANGVVIEVEDDGPGCSAEQLGRLTGRGVRLDESVDGHGLGLSIVKDIVDSYDGELRFASSSRMGGLLASVHLPARSDAKNHS